MSARPITRRRELALMERVKQVHIQCSVAMGNLDERIDAWEDCLRVANEPLPAMDSALHAQLVRELKRQVNIDRGLRKQFKDRQKSADAIDPLF